MQFRLFAALLIAAFVPVLACAQGVPNSAIVVTTCGTPPATYSAGQNKPVLQDVNGNGCVNTTGTITGSVTITGSLPAGSNIIGQTGIDQTTPGATNGVVIAPTSASAAGIVPVVSASAEGSHVLKSSAGNLYSLYVTTGATAGYVMTFNATSAPADGSVTPVDCVQAPANTTTSMSFGAGPAGRFSTGITAVFSSTGCFSKTVSATAFFKASVQ